ncbi:MAG: recombination regulator RecX [Bacteroidales bacterium]|nr:recombination regulator RecX [Bacteroidales bacterium]
MDEKTALNYYAALCSKSEHCEFDIREKMRKADLDEEVQERVISYLRTEKFIDDQRYAEVFVHDKAMFNGWGPIKIRFELNARHIKSDAIEDALDAIDDTIFDQQLRKAIESKMRSTKKDDFMKLKASLLRYGGSRGFAFDHVSFVVKDILKKNSD